MSLLDIFNAIADFDFDWLAHKIILFCIVAGLACHYGAGCKRLMMPASERVKLKMQQN